MKQTKKLLSLVMALAMVLSLLPLAAVPAGALEPVDGIYQIGSADDLKAFRDLVNGGETTANAVLTADIDLQGSDSNRWTPIGRFFTSFNPEYAGTFDGQGHRITGLYVNVKDRNAGLFGAIGTSGRVENLSVSGSVTSSSSDSAGGIVGWNYGTVSGCVFRGTVAAAYSGYNGGGDAGGIVGYNVGGTVARCVHSGSVSVTCGGYVCAGGVVGSLSGGTMEACLHSGGEVTATSTTNADAYAGGVAGESKNGGTITGCYYLTGTATNGIGNGTGTATGLSAEQMKNAASFSGWDFATVWYMGTNGPELLDLAVPRPTSTWSDLQTALQTSGAIRLTDDVKWQSGDLALVVPEGKTVKLDLNGHTVDRGLAGKEAVVDGCVIKVNGSLTLCDSGSGGTITGGNTTASGGGVDVANEGTFTLRGGAISGNTATGYGGGVVIRENCKFYMTGGEIRNNTAGTGGGGVDIYKGSFAMTGGTISGNSATAGDGGGVYIHGTFTLDGGTISSNTATGNGGGVFMYSGTIQIKGTPEISGNSKNEAPNNLYLSSGIKITITGPLDDTASIGVTMRTPGVFTSGLSGNGTAANFTSDNAAYNVGLNASGEVLLGNAKVIFHANDDEATEATKEQVIVKGAETALAANPFTRDGYLFLGWKTKDGSTGYTDGQTVTLAGDLDLYAQWRKTPKAIESGADVLRVYANTPDTQVVRFGGLDWYVIAYDGKDGVGNAMQYEQETTGQKVDLYPEGTVTLLVKDTPKYGTYKDDWYGTSEYASSDMKTKIDGENGIVSGLSAEERAAVTSRTLEGGSGTRGSPTYDSNKISDENNVENALLWPLSVAEANALSQGIRNTFSYAWWLRTPGINPNQVAYIQVDTKTPYLNGEHVKQGLFWDIRPACYLNLSSVLLTSPATDGKTGDLGTLNEIGNYTGNKWKLTVLDNSRAFNVTETTARALPGGDVTLHYTGATVNDGTTAPNEYVSALLCDSNGEPISYGKLAQPSSASGTVTVTAPDETGSYTLKLFSEQINGDNVTDYASAFDAVALTVSTDPAPSSGGHTSTYPVTLPANVENGAVTVTPQRPAAGQTVTLTAAPDEGYRADAVTVTDKDGKAVALTDNGDGTYTFFMPASPVEVAAVFVPVERPFVDVPEDAWFYEAVYYCYDHDLFKGIDAAHFDPTGTMTRAMFATVLYRMAGEPPVTGENPFTDVENGTWYTDPVIWAASEKIIEGYGDGLFGTNDPVTREQIAAILYRYAQSKGQGFVGSWMFPLDYPDAGEVSAWADEAMHWMVMNGVITGNPDGTLAPKATATRAEVATMLMRFEGLG